MASGDSWIFFGGGEYDKNSKKQSESGKGAKSRKIVSRGPTVFAYLF